MLFTALECRLKPSAQGRSFTDYEFIGPPDVGNPTGAPYTGQLWSKSAIEKYVLCPRKWAWQWLAGIREPMGNAAQLGVDLHAEVEQWLVAGAPPSSKIITDSGVLGKLPLPGTPSLRAEHAFALRVDWDDPQGNIHTSGFWGFKDVSVNSYLPDGTVLPTVIDLKSKGDLVYAMTAAELSKDLQACLYGLHACKEVGSKAATVKWAYIQTKGKPKHQITESTLLTADMAAVVAGFLPALLEMEQYRAQKTSPNPLPVLQVPANPNSCADYGGCFFREQHCTDLKAGSRLLASLHQSRHEGQRRLAQASIRPDLLGSAPQAQQSPAGLPAESSNLMNTPTTPPPTNPVLARIQADLLKRQQAAMAGGSAVSNIPQPGPQVPVATQTASSAASNTAASNTAAATQTAAPHPHPGTQPATQPTPTPSVINKLARLKDMLAASQVVPAAPAVSVQQAADVAAANMSALAANATASLTPAESAVLAMRFAGEAAAGSAAAQPAPATQPAPPAVQPPAVRGKGRPAGARNRPKAGSPALSPEQQAQQANDAAFQARADVWPTPSRF